MGMQVNEVVLHTPYFNHPPPTLNASTSHDREHNPPVAIVHVSLVEDVWTVP